MRKEIDIARDFSTRPYGRYFDDGPDSGERFRKEYLVPALNSHAHVFVDMSGTNRYGSSFIDEAFGGLIRSEGFSLEQLRQRLEIRHTKLPSLAEMTWNYIEGAAKEG